MKTFILLTLAVSAMAQTGQFPPGGGSGISHGTILPASCTIGQAFFKDDAAAGQNLYGCTAPNIWTVLGAGTGGGDMVTTSYVTSGAGAPVGSCSPDGATYRNTAPTPDTYYFCASNAWVGPFTTSADIAALGTVYLGLHAKADTAGNADTVTNGVYTTGAGTVFLAPNGSAAALTGFPTLNQDTTGTAAKATTPAGSLVKGRCLHTNSTTGAFEETGADCGSGSIANASLGAGAASISRTATAGVGGVTAKYLAAKDTTDPTRRVLPASGGCGGGIAATTATVGNAFELFVVPGTVITGVADNAITAGHILVGGTTIPGRVLDSGQTSRKNISSSTCVVGVALQSVTTGSDVLLEYDGPGSFGAGIQASDLPATGGPATSTSLTITLPHSYARCSGTPCAVSVPAPTAPGQDFCVWAAPGVSSVITLTGASGVFFALADMSAYSTTSGGTAISTAAAGNSICMVSADATHWDFVGKPNGNWTVTP